jgi:hypothetical protein
MGPRPALLAVLADAPEFIQNFALDKLVSSLRNACRRLPAETALEQAPGLEHGRRRRNMSHE